MRERDVEERRRRSHELDLEVGAAPFDPGRDYYDDRKAKRDAKRRQKTEREPPEPEQDEAQAERDRAAAEREREQAARKQREREERERRARAGMQRAEKERAAREAELQRQREDRQRAQRERAKRAHDERERLREQERVERDRAERERREEKRHRREERDREIAAERERKEKERAERARQDRAARERRERRRRQRTQAKRPRRTKAAGRQPAAAAPARTKAPAPRKRAPAKLRTAPTGPRRRTPKPRQTATAPRPRPGHVSLKKPTAKLGGTAAAIAAAAIGLGALLGLPVPLLNDDSAGTSTSLASEGSLAGIDPGTPQGLTKGPYFPVVLDTPANFGEAAAKFGAPRSGHRHEGQDVFAKPGTPLVAVRDGVVLDGAGGRNFYSTGGGNTLVIYSAIDNRSYVYLHMLKPALVKNGDEVRAGQLVGQVGCTGSCDGPHLHFEVRNGRAYWGAKTKAVDPLPLMRQWPQRPTG